MIEKQKRKIFASQYAIYAIRLSSMYVLYGTAVLIEKTCSKTHTMEEVVKSYIIRKEDYDKNGSFKEGF